ncbi:MAG: serine/threonine protein kinase, partial [Planctomycetota bacterium]
LYARQEGYGGELCDALRQCDGQRVQAIIMVRNDYWTPTSEFFAALDFRLLERENCQPVNLFDLAHARKVLALFGQAYGALPASEGQGEGVLSDEQNAFLDAAVNELAEQGKVVSVRLAVFAELMHGRPWKASTLESLGGAAGIGVAFLEEAFASPNASPVRKRHASAAQRVLRSLLPPLGTEIKGLRRTGKELIAAADYAQRPEEYTQLIRILDDELRLITPSFDDEQKKIGYQLTHDYLVPSLRDWLTRKQRETPRGRAELRLEERAAAWSLKRENRQLPSVVEYVRIASLTEKKNWTAGQRSVMARATWVHGWRALLILILSMAIATGLLIREKNQRQQLTARIQGLVDDLVRAEPSQLTAIIAELNPNRRIA